MYKTTLILLIFAIITGCSSIVVKPYTQSEKAQEIYENGLKLVAAREYHKAIEYFEYLIQKFNTPENEKYIAWATYEIGFCYYRLGKEEKAIQYFDIVLTQHKKERSPRILANLVKEKIKRGDGYKNTSYN